MHVAEQLKQSAAFHSSILETSATRESTILQTGIVHACKYPLFPFVHSQTVQ